MNLKEKIRNSGIRQWRIAEALEIDETTLCRWLRRPEKLSKEKVENINKVINEINKIKERGA